jgi:hypothetical protein
MKANMTAAKALTPHTIFAIDIVFSPLCVVNGLSRLICKPRSYLRQPAADHTYFANPCKAVLKKDKPRKNKPRRLGQRGINPFVGLEAILA